MTEPHVTRDAQVELVLLKTLIDRAFPEAKCRLDGLDAFYPDLAPLYLDMRMAGYVIVVQTQKGKRLGVSCVRDPLVPRDPLEGYGQYMADEYVDGPLELLQRIAQLTRVGWPTP